MSDLIDWSELTGTPIVLGDTTCGDGQFLQYSTGFSAWGCVNPSSAENDPVFAASPASGINATDISLWDQSYGWGDHSAANYLTSESDPVFAASVAGGIDNSDIAAWNTTAGYGDHSAVGYLTGDTLSALNCDDGDTARFSGASGA